MKRVKHLLTENSKIPTLLEKIELSFKEMNAKDYKIIGGDSAVDISKHKSM